MKLTFKKRLAKEWLTLLVGLVFGITVVPIFFMSIAAAFEVPDSTGLVPRLREGYGSLVKELLIEPRPFAWLVVLLPYGLYQLVRSLRWAIRTLRQ